jgi:multisubunit Na+/H+ antiporter MnhG subunit
VSWREILALVLGAAGVACDLLAVVGLCAMRSAYDRLHLLGLASFGGLFVGCAVLARESFSLIGDKSLLVGGVLVLGGPIVTQTTLRSLLIREHGDWRAPLEEDG